jgi:hypothetical protein
MTHAHDHVHDPSAYYTQQLCTIGICGGLGGVAIMLYFGERLFVLAEQFRVMVLFSGIALVTLVVIRSVALWISAGKALPGHEHHHDHEHHDHSHDHHHHHDHEHGIMADPHHHPAAAVAVVAAAGGLPLVSDSHDHAHAHHHDHDHNHGGDGHDHDHTWDSLKFMVLLIPIVLYFLNIPSSVLSAEKDGFHGDLAPGAHVQDKDFDDSINFRTLEGANLIPEKRKYLEGRRCTLKGQFVASGRSDMFTLVRYRRYCCATDAVPIPAVILIDNSLVKDLKDLRDDQKTINPAEYKREWVEVTGQIQFRKISGTEDYVTVVLVRPTKEKPLSQLIKKVQADRDPYV